jgi:hypothetical protein
MVFIYLEYNLKVEGNLLECAKIQYCGGRAVIMKENLI